MCRNEFNRTLSEKHPEILKSILNKIEIEYRRSLDKFTEGNQLDLFDKSDPCLDIQPALSNDQCNSIEGFGVM